MDRGRALIVAVFAEAGTAQAPAKEPLNQPGVMRLRLFAFQRRKLVRCLRPSVLESATDEITDQYRRGDPGDVHQTYRDFALLAVAIIRDFRLIS